MRLQRGRTYKHKNCSDVLFYIHDCRQVGLDKWLIKVTYTDYQGRIFNKETLKVTNERYKAFTDGASLF